MNLWDYYENLKRLDTPVVMRAGIRAVPKARPRLGRRGFVYTPETTQHFEAQIRVLAKSVMGHRLPYSCPVKVTITITEPIPPSHPKWRTKLADAGLVLPPRGDLDNRVKAVTDAMNGIVYQDDNQVGEIAAVKRYGSAYLIHVVVERTGLSDLEIDRYKKMKKVNDEQPLGGRRPTMG